MKQPIWIVLMFILSHSMEGEYVKVISFNPGALLEVSNEKGGLSITPWDKDSLKISAVGDVEEIPVVSILTKQGAKIKVLSTDVTKGKPIDLAVKVPKEVNLLIENREGNIFVDSIKGDVTCKAHLFSEIRLNLLQGNISLFIPEKSALNLYAKTSLGEINCDISHAFGVGSGESSQIRIRTGEKKDRGIIEVKTNKGDIEIKKAKL